jgi:hypothetical protein
MSNNKGPDLQIYILEDFNYSEKDLINLSIENSQMGSSFLCRALGVNFKRCQIKDVIRIDYSDYIRIDSKTIIKKLLLNENGQNIVIK